MVPAVFAQPNATQNLERVVRPLVAELRRTIENAPPGPDAAREVLATAPALACQHLADLWAEAGPLGDLIRNRLSPEDRSVLDLVVSTFLPSCSELIEPITPFTNRLSLDDLKALIEG